MAQPFAAETWIRRSDIPGILLNGTYAATIGPQSAVYDKESRVVQVFNKQAHHFEGFANTAQVSVDDGASWVTVFNEAANPGLNQVAFNGWSMPSPTGVGRVHFQVRWKFTHSFFVADGTTTAGWVTLYASGDGVSYFPLQELHAWPHHIADPAFSGGGASFNAAPSCTQPIRIGEFWWMASAFSFDAGGTNNRQTFRAAVLWRSSNGIEWEQAGDLTAAFGSAPSFGYFFRSSTGRLFLQEGVALFYTDDVDDLLNATWTLSPVVGPFGNVVQFYGGTLATNRQGSLVSAGFGQVSCDDGVSWTSAGVTGLPIAQSRNGYMQKLGPAEGLVVTAGFDDPTTTTVAYYTANGGETWQDAGVWLVSSIGEEPCMLDIRANGTPIVISRGGGCFISSDKARGVAGTRTVCPLANAGLAAARPLLICGHPLTHLCEDH